MAKVNIETREVPRAYVRTFRGKGWAVKADNPKKEMVTMTKASKAGGK